MTAQSLRPMLEREHRQWIDELTGMLGPALRTSAGAWPRWDALRYLQSTFPVRLARERQLVDALGPALTNVERETLWALGELLNALGQQLDQVGLCQRAEQFSVITGRIVTALRHWCQAVEDDLGPLTMAEVPVPARDLLSGFAAAESLSTA